MSAAPGWVCAQCTVRNNDALSNCRECGLSSGRAPPAANRSSAGASSSKAASSLGIPDDDDDDADEGIKLGSANDDDDVICLEDDEDDDDVIAPTAAAAKRANSGTQSRRLDVIEDTGDEDEDGVGEGSGADSDFQIEEPDEVGVKPSRRPPPRVADPALAARRAALLAEATAEASPSPIEDSQASARVGSKRKGGAVGGKAAAAASKAAAKEQKTQELHAARSERGAYSKLELVAALSRDLVDSPVGNAIQESLAGGDVVVARTVERPSDVVEAGEASSLAVLVPPIPRTVHWWRRRVDPKRGVFAFLPGLTVEPFVVQVYVDAQFLDLLTSQGTDGVAAALAWQRGSLAEGTRIIYVLQGVRQAAARGQGRHGAVTSDALDHAFMHLYVMHDLEVKETLNAAKTAEYIASLSRAIAEFPYRMDPTALACIVKVRVASSGGAAAAAGGDHEDDEDAPAASSSSRPKKSSSDTWLAQLQMIPRVSDKVARAIVARYPTFRSLHDAYATATLSRVEKEKLLEDVMIDGAGAGRAITKLSSTIFHFFTTMDGSEIIGT